MAKQKLVKILSDGSCDVNTFTEENIAEYVQTKQTIDRINNYLVNPFEESLKSLGTGEVFSSDNLFLGVKSRDKNIKYSPKDILTLTENVVSLNNTQNTSGIRLDGVKRFNGTIAIDAGHVYSLMQDWKSKILGKRSEVGIENSCDDLENIVSIHSPRLIMLDDYFNFDVNDLSKEDVKFYLAGVEHSKKLKKLIIDPFESAFKSNVDVAVGSSSRDVKHYGGLSVAVNCVSRDEANYSKSVGLVENELSSIVNLSANDCVSGELFWNSERKIPRMYVNSSSLLSKIEEFKSQKFPKMKKEVSILYKPVEAHIL